jgi:hypothetical protein
VCALQGSPSRVRLAVPSAANIAFSLAGRNVVKKIKFLQVRFGVLR